ncbi:dual specificity protein kinase CLK1-like isoform X1 [Gadus chalcogrammus]|uniref:dual specificity protein kinase CLK1-like isoform X1 n=3 Tax=Gadus chalcogrammus TaxID=1042646 RepID=UPI0024C34ECF|nr:dual specificity protein kinase CLK1-like isoform X1 [Gadus chalcogrammus]
MRRSKRQHSPEEEWVEDGYGSQRKEEAQTTKRPRRSSPVEEAELKDTCPRKNHHGKTYERCRQNTNRPHQALQSKAREPRRGVGAWDRTRAMGTLIRTSNGKDMEVPVCHSARTETNINTGGPTRPQTLAHSDAHLHSVHTQQKVPHSSAHAHTQRTHSHTRSRVNSRSGSQNSNSRSGGTKRKSCGGDGEGHLVYDAGLLLNERYEVVSTLGEGAFGKVVECLDRNKSERVALKIVKNIERYREAAQSEIAVLGEINSLDDDHTFACVRMLDWFDHHGHICIVFELLGLSTFDYLRENDFLPFTVEHIRHMAFQIFRAVCFLHRNKVTHTDLKPENILFVRSDYDMEYNDRLKRDQRTLKSLDVKVVDFGNATFDRDHHPSLVSTRHYRAPEVILDLGWNQACDVWSLGCILMEYYLGLTVFQTHDSKEHLAMMERVLGPIPPSLLSKTRKRHFVERERLDWDEHSNSGRYVRKHCKPLKQYMQSRSAEHQQLFELIGSMLEYDVSRRITMEEALWHPFFTPLRMVRCP